MVIALVVILFLFNLLASDSRTVDIMDLRIKGGELFGQSASGATTIPHK